jgi:hypothetical protein
MHDVSPELALVDGALAERERERLPEPEDCLAPHPLATAPVEPPPALTLLAEPEPEPVPDVPAPATESEPPLEPSRRAPSLALAEPPADPAPAPVEVVPFEVPAAVVEPEPVPEPALAVEPDEEADEPAPGPVRMPEWVASDVAPKSRRLRRKANKRARREARREQPRAMRRRVAVAASWVVLCGFLASPLLAFFPSPNGERPTLAPDGVQSVPDAGENAGHQLRWEPVPEAAGYSVVFVNDGDRSDRWSETARLRLPAGTESEQLVTYEWFVYPAFRDGAGYRYGPLVASGDVTMPKLAPTESS